MPSNFKNRRAPTRSERVGASIRGRRALAEGGYGVNPVSPEATPGSFLLTPCLEARV